MVFERIAYQAGGAACIGALVYNEQIAGRRPLLLVSPNWCGMAETALQRAQVLAGDKYIAFVADMFGDGKVAVERAECAALANGLRAEPQERRRRIAAALDTLKAEAEKRGIGDSARSAAVGFCFGGGCVLELARMGADVSAVISLHGDLLAKIPAKPGEIKAAVAILHGASDPVVPKEHRDIVEAEMQAAGARWQMLSFGHLLHAFTEAEETSDYDEAAARQSFRFVDQFATDAFEGRL